MLDDLLVAHFASKGTRRSIGLTVPYSSGIGLTVAASDLVLTAPVGPAMTKEALCAMLRDIPRGETHACMRHHSFDQAEDLVPVGTSAVAGKDTDPSPCYCRVKSLPHALRRQMMAILETPTEA